MKQIVKFKVNGMEEEKAVHTHHTLLEVLRAEFKLFGAREGCRSACAALHALDGRRSSCSCYALAKEDLTIEARPSTANSIRSNRHLLTTMLFNAPIAHRASS